MRLPEDMRSAMTYTIIVWSLLGVGSWLGMRVVRRRRGGPVGRQPWSNENRNAIHDIIARGARD